MQNQRSPKKIKYTSSNKKNSKYSNKCTCFASCFDNCSSSSYRNNINNASKLRSSRCEPRLTSTSNNNDSTISTRSSSTATTSSSIGVNLRVTGQCSQGGRKYMEDFFSVAYQQTNNDKELEYTFIGIYDGHGGPEAATFAKENLMIEIIKQQLFWSDSDQDIMRAIREGYIATHFAMWREQDKWPRTVNGHPSTAGTTATVAFIRREKIYIGHVGDSGIVLGYQNKNENFWRAKQLTTDHKPESQKERTRILRSGGNVAIKSGVPRVVWHRPRNATHRGPIGEKTPIDDIPFLAVARSLGDLWSFNSEHNEFIVSPDPEVKVIKIDPKSFRCLIFGTDGLWNVLSAQEAVDTVYEKELLNNCKRNSNMDNIMWSNPSKCLVDRALRTWSSKKMRADNTSVVTAILYPTKNNDIHKCLNLSQKMSRNSFCSERKDEYYDTSQQFNIDEYDSDSIPYSAISKKYLPPEEYRVYNYNKDKCDDVKLINKTDEYKDVEKEIIKREVCLMEDEKETSLYSDWKNVCNDLNVTTDDCANNSWEWSEIEIAPAQDIKASTPTTDDSLDTIDGSADDMEINIVVEHCSKKNSNLEESFDIEQTTCYSFAESYNSLLNEEISQQSGAQINTVSTSTAACSTNAPLSKDNCGNQELIWKMNINRPPSVNEILQEQQRYQQQEGYSLTKLETRNEQEHCKYFEKVEVLPTLKPQYQQEVSEICQHQYSVNGPGVNRNYPQYHQKHNQHNKKHQAEMSGINSMIRQENEKELQVTLEQSESEQPALQETFIVESFQKLPTKAAGVADSHPIECLETKGAEESVDAHHINEVNSMQMFEANTNTHTMYSKSSCDSICKDQTSARNEIGRVDNVAAKTTATARCDSSSATSDSKSAVAADDGGSSRRKSENDNRKKRYRNIPNGNFQQQNDASGSKNKNNQIYLEKARVAIVSFDNKKDGSGYSVHKTNKTIKRHKKNINNTTVNTKRLLRSSGFSSVDLNNRTLRNRNMMSKTKRSNPTFNNQIVTLACCRVNENIRSSQGRSLLKHPKFQNFGQHSVNQKVATNVIKNTSYRTKLSRREPTLIKSTAMTSESVINLRPRRPVDASAAAFSSRLPALTIVSDGREHRRCLHRQKGGSVGSIKQHSSSDINYTNSSSNFSKPIRSQSANVSIVARPPPSPKQFSNAAATCTRSFLAAKVDFNKRWTLRSNASINASDNARVLNNCSTTKPSKITQNSISLSETIGTRSRPNRKR